MRVLILFLIAFVPLTSFGGGIIPDRINQLIIEGRFDQPQPQFIVVFSVERLKGPDGKPLTSATAEELQALKSEDDQVVLKLHGKPVNKSGRVDYFFGSGDDSDKPWNDGKEFRWQDWEKHSADVWDHVAIAAVPGTEGRNGAILSVTIRKGGKLLYDSRATKSYPNQKPIRCIIPAFQLKPNGKRYPVLNLSEEMARFRNDYYELGNNSILLTAYADLGQTEKRKYAKRGNNWCSEFASHVYRSNDVTTPDPNAGDVHFKNMAEFFKSSGTVYPMREVAKWSNAEKQKKIKPGSFVSILIGDSTHSLIFTTWVNPKPGESISKYAAVSGNNKGMVWSHEPLSLPSPDDYEKLSAEKLLEYDQKVYFAVPADK